MNARACDVIVVGEGITGLTAARRCAEAGLQVITFERQLFGGLITSINELVDWIDPSGVCTSGSDLASTRIAEAVDAGATSEAGEAVALAADGAAITLLTDAGRHRAGALIVASGAARRGLGLPDEQRYADRGVSLCADCDGPMVKGADVVVVGGGDSALQEAAVLAHYARTVHLVHRGSAFRARPAVQAVFEQAFSERPDALQIHWQTTVSGLEGEQGLEAVVLTGADGTQSRVAARALFPCVGLVPNSAWTGLELDANGAIVTGAGLSTSRPGVYAAGAVRAGFGGRLMDAEADGEAAAASAIAAIAAARDAGR